MRVFVMAAAAAAGLLWAQGAEAVSRQISFTGDFVGGSSTGGVPASLTGLDSIAVSITFDDASASTGTDAFGTSYGNAITDITLEFFNATPTSLGSFSGSSGVIQIGNNLFSAFDQFRILAATDVPSLPAPYEGFSLDLTLGINEFASEALSEIDTAMLTALAGDFFFVVDTDPATQTLAFTLNSGGTVEDAPGGGGGGADVPLPAGLPMLLAGLAGLGLISRRRA